MINPLNNQINLSYAPSEAAILKKIKGLFSVFHHILPVCVSPGSVTGCHSCSTAALHRAFIIPWPCDSLCAGGGGGMAGFVES